MSYHSKIKRLHGAKALTKTQSWREDLHAYLESLRDKKFEWGSVDCCTFISGAVEAMTGTNPMAQAFFHTYDSVEGAKEALEKFSGSTKFNQGLLQTVSSICDMFGIVKIQAGFRSFGDIVIYRYEGEYTCVISAGVHLTGIGKNELQFIVPNAADIVAVYRVNQGE